MKSNAPVKMNILFFSLVSRLMYIGCTMDSSSIEICNAAVNAVFFSDMDAVLLCLVDALSIRMPVYFENRLMRFYSFIT